MGKEIEHICFKDEDYNDFKRHLRNETKLLKNWFKEDVFSKDKPMVGLEIEGWFVDEDFLPSDLGNKVICEANDPLIVPEISRYNFEINCHPYYIDKNLLENISKDIQNLWGKISQSAKENNLKTLAIGTLPTLRDQMLNMECLSPQKRYAALNEIVMKHRNNRPIHIHLEGREELELFHNDVITECAATSMQIHLGTTQEKGGALYNASCYLSPFMAAISANSPFLFGKDLWDESRIPLFEQSVEFDSFRTNTGRVEKRVSMGTNYIRDSLFELFLENLDGHEILLPEIGNNHEEWLDHLRLHNGTIWRWNRPLIGLNGKGQAGLRIEHRVPSAGPSIDDMVANIAFYLGLAKEFESNNDYIKATSFEELRSNFYLSCQKGFEANIQWNGKTQNIQDILLNELLPKVRQNLIELEISEASIEYYIDDILYHRLLNGQNGANWQRSFIDTHGPRFQEMLEVYYDYQNKNIPVHKWKVD